MLQRLPIVLAQISASNNPEHLLNEIKQIFYSLYQSTEIYIYILCYRVLCYKAFNTANNPKYDGYHRGLASLKGSDLDIKENEKLAEEFQKPVNKSF